jgi:tetratricopeptide (TPR) repeat protein
MRFIRRLVVLSSLVLICICAPALVAQTRTNSSGNGGINTIKGQIFTPGNKRGDGSVTVKLQTFGAGELTLVTDQSGGFEFRGLTPGSYIVVVDAGDPFDEFRESVTIDPDVQPDPGLGIRIPPTPKVYTVPVYLQFKRSVQEKAAVVNAKLAGVPKDALKHYDKGVEFAQAGKGEEAIAEFRTATQLYPAFTWAYTEMGKIYLRTNRLDDAVTALATAVRYDPEDFDSNIDYGVALYAKRDFTAAETQLSKAGQLNATAVTPHYYLGLLYFQTKAMEKAQAELESAKRLKGDKNFPLVHRYLGEVYRSRNLNKQAVTELETYLAVAPKAKDADAIRQTIADLKAKI